MQNLLELIDPLWLANRVQDGFQRSSKNDPQKATGVHLCMFNAKDLSKEPPRSPRVRMGGYSILVRTIDKGRAVLNGTVGEYEYNCGLDQMLFGFKGLDHEEVKRFLATGASDEEVLDWVNSHGTPKTSAEIEEFSNSFEKFRPYHDPDLRELFRKTYGSLGLDPKTSTVADYLDTDDRVSFKK